jgi:hypothetical protein
MRSSLFAALAAGILVLSPQTVFAQARFGIAAGLAVPVGDLGNDADLGYNFAASLNFGGTHVPLGARIEGAFNGFNLKNSSEDVRILDLTANAIANVGQRPTSPYFIGGLGIYNSKHGDFDSKTEVGINLGGGLRFPVGDMTTFLEARYHLMFGDRTDFANNHFIPISFGVVF